jgi:RNA polymerase sigma factor (sigma-70 family)
MDDSTDRDPSEPERSSPEAIAWLVTRAQQGDVAAQHALATRFQPLMRRVLAPYSRETRDDLEGEVHLLFHGLILEYDPGRGAGFPTFVARTLPLRLSSRVKEERDHTERETPGSHLLSQAADAEPLSEEELAALFERLPDLATAYGVEDTALLQVLLEDALSALTPRRRAIVRMRVEGFSFHEIAAAIGATPAVCRQEFQRARRALKEMLQDF